MPREAQTGPRVTRGDKARHLYLWGDGQQWQVTFVRVTIGHFLHSVRHEEPMKSMCLYETLDIISRHTPAIDWSKEAKRASEAIRISPTSATITCYMKGKIVEALHDPAVEVCILPESLLDTLVGNKPLTPTDKYFKSLSGLYFECRGIARDVPITIDKIEMHLDFLHLRYPRF